MQKPVKQDYAAISAAHRTVLKEIERIPGRKKYKSVNIEIQCPFHPGDNTPSCGIYIGTGGSFPIGWFFCLGCGAKGPWNKLADKLKLQKIERSDSKRDSAAVSQSELDKARAKCLGDSYSTIPEYAAAMGLGVPKPFDLPQWRRINGQLMRDLGALIALDTRSKKPRYWVLLPVTLYGELVTVVRGAMYKIKGERSYLVFDDADTRTKGLFGFDLVVDMFKKPGYDWVVLVEGQRDALRLIQYGIPALAILGTQSWSDAKRDLILGLGKGVVLLMDGDAPGVEAQAKMKQELERRCDVMEFNLNTLTELYEMKIDPGNMPHYMLRELQEVNPASRKLNGRRVPRYSRRAEREHREKHIQSQSRFEVVLDEVE